jgi:hypothetical protein
VLCLIFRSPVRAALLLVHTRPCSFSFLSRSIVFFFLSAFAYCLSLPLVARSRSRPVPLLPPSLPPSLPRPVPPSLPPKIVALDLLLVCALAKSVWEREAYPHQGVMVAARRPD